MSESTEQPTDDGFLSGEADPASRYTSLSAAASLGLPALAGMLVDSDDGICVIDGDRRYTYANPSACQLLGRSLRQLSGREFLDSFPARDRTSLQSRLLDRSGDTTDPFPCTLLGPDGVERHIFCTTSVVDVQGSRHVVATIRDFSGSRSAWRTAMALAQTTAQMVGTGTTEEIMVDIARHGVEDTRGVAVSIVVVGDDHRLVAAGGYGFPSAPRSREAWLAGSITLDDLPGGPAVLENRVVVIPDARSIWERSPVMRGFADTVKELDWDASVFVPLSWEDQVFGVFGVYLPAGVTEPTAAELAFFTALANQAALVVTNARLSASAERSRLARDLHDSVSQALFSMTMHARAAQLSLVKAGGDEDGPLGRSIAQLADLTRGALAEMRALIFELRPEALAEEGLVAALRKQGAALSAREEVAIEVDGPEGRLDLSPRVEEHLYRLVSEALHNVVKHAHADHAAVLVSTRSGTLEVTVTDDGAGFDPGATAAGHLGLGTMTERAEAVGSELRVTSAPGRGTVVALVLPYGGPEGERGSKSA